MSRKTRLSDLARLLTAGLVLAAIGGGCAPRVDVRGHVPNPEALATIRAGEQTRDDVADLLGTPSAIGAFSDQRWYYVTRRTETVAFYEPEVVSQEIVVIEFDDSGVVSKVGSVDLASAREIDPVDDETPTRGRELGLLEQLLGNLGAPTALGGQ